jgi:hypothetical protein
MLKRINCTIMILFVISLLYPLLSTQAAVTSTISFSPASTSVSTGQTFNLTASINPNGNAVTAIMLNVTFDASRLELTTVTPSTAFSNKLAGPTIDNIAGTASMDVGVPTTNTTGVTSLSDVAVFSFKSKTTGGSASVNFTSNTMAAAIGNSGNVITTRNGATVTVQAINTAPKGNIDTANTASIVGWAYDSDAGANAIRVDIYMDGTATANFLGNTTANLTRNDIATSTIVGVNHGFNYAMPASITTGNHTFYVFAINSPASDVNPQISGSPKTVNFSDTQKPTTPTGLKATVISSTQINLSWTASTDNVAVTGYKVYRNGSQIATPITNGYENTGLTPSTAYTYYVTAFDSAGNVSGNSNTVSATTQAQPNIAPKGNIDSANTASIVGWAYDSDAGANAIRVDIYMDGTATANFLGNATANLARSDIATSSIIGINHGFNYAMPASITTGNHTFYVFAINSPASDVNPQISGSPKTVNFPVVDNTAPILSNGIPTGTIAATSSTSIGVTTNESATCRYFFSPNTTYDNMANYPFTSSDGITHRATIHVDYGATLNVYVRCRDKVGNTNTSDYTISFSVNNQSNVINGQCGSAMQKNFDNAPTTDLCISGTSSVITTENWGWSWQCNGTNGGYSSSCHAYKNTDTNPPVITNGIPTGTISATSTALIGVTTNESASCRYYMSPNTTYDNMANYPFTSSDGVTHRVDLAVSPGTAYKIYARCRDKTGNTNTSDYTISFSVANQVSSNATISFQPASQNINSSQTFSLTAKINPNGNGVTAVMLNVSFDATRLELSNVTQNTAFSVKLAGPIIDNTAGAVSMDVGIPTTNTTGVTSLSDVAVFNFKAKTLSGSASVNFTANTKAAALGKTGDVIATRNGATVNVTSTCQNVCTLGAKQCSGNGYQACINTDTGCTGWNTVTNCASGQTCSAGNCIANETPLNISNINISNITDTSALIKFNTNNPAKSYIEYGLTNTYGLKTKVNDIAATNFNTTLSSLQADKMYHFMIVASDDTNTAKSEDMTFTTLKSIVDNDPIVREAKDIFERNQRVHLSDASIKLYNKVIGSSGSQLNDQAKFAIAYFIEKGSVSTRRLSNTARADILIGYKQNYGELPSSLDDWIDIVRISNGMWPKHFNARSESQAISLFKKIYQRSPNMENFKDKNTVYYIAYDLHSKKKDLRAEKSVLIKFRKTFGDSPDSNKDWSVVRAIAYGGAKK